MGKVIDAVLAYIEAQVGNAQYSRTYRMKAGYFDCSSIVYRAYKAAGVTLADKDSGKTVSTSCYEVYAKGFQLLYPASYAEIGRKLPSAVSLLPSLNLQGGEHIFYCMDSNTKRANKITHVSTVRKGGKQIVHARNTKDDVCINNLSYGSTRVCAVIRYIEADEVPSISRVLMRTLPNMEGEDVRMVQQVLIDRGFSCGKKGADGKFGKNTDAAVRAFQTQHPECGTKGKPDGHVGPKTVTTLGFVWKG